MPLLTSHRWTRSLGVLLVAGATSLGGLPATAATPPPSPPSPPSVTVVSPRQVPVSGTFDVVLDVAPGDAPLRSVDVHLWWKHELHRDLGAGCADGCRVTVPVDLDAWQAFDGERDPLAFFGSRLVATVTDSEGRQGEDFTEVSQVVHPPGVLLVQRTVDVGVRGTVGAATAVTGTEVAVTALLDTRDETSVGVVEARLTARGAAAGTPALRSVVVDPYLSTGGVRGDLRVPVGSLPEGWYDLVVRATGPTGAYGPGWRTQVLVRRTPDVSWSGDVELDRGQAPFRDMTVQRTRSSGVTPTTVRVAVRPTTAGAGPALERDVPFSSLLWPEQVGDADRWRVELDGYAPAPGSYATSWQLLDGRGLPMAPPSTATMRVTGDAAVRWQPPTVEESLDRLPVPVRATLTAPPGRTVVACSVEVAGPGRVHTYRSGDLCTGARGGAVATPSWSFVPWSQGTHQVTLSYTLSGSLARVASTTFVVGSPVRLTTQVPDLVHGQRVDAVAVARESRGPGRPAVPKRYAEVRFQVRWAGTTAWLDAGTVIADADGRAVLPVRPGRSGTWRAVTRTGDAVTPFMTSPEDASVVRASATLTSVPSTATAGRAVTVSGTVGPGDAEPAVRVQIVKHGSNAWKDAAVVTPSAGKISARVAFPSSGRWYVRLVRPASTAVAQGTSSNTRVDVR